MGFIVALIFIAVLIIAGFIYGMVAAREDHFTSLDDAVQKIEKKVKRRGYGLSDEEFKVVLEKLIFNRDQLMTWEEGTEISRRIGQYYWKNYKQ